MISAAANRFVQLLPASAGTTIKPWLRSKVFARLYARMVAWEISRKVTGNPDDEGVLRILQFNPHRARQDTEILARTGRAAIYPFKFDYVSQINSLFIKNLRGLDAWVQYNHDSRDNGLVTARNAHIAYVAEFLNELRSILNIDAIVTPSAQYVVEWIWSQAAESIGLLFTPIHKEMTTLNEWQIDIRVERERKHGRKWNGGHVFVTNDVARTVAIKSGLITPDRVSISGLIRFDDLRGPICRPHPDLTALPESLTLFSFAHLTGAFEKIGPRRSHYFSLNDDQGFVRLFNEVHGAFAEYAIAHPDVTCYVKPKNFEPNWNGEIRRAVREGTGRELDSIPNLKLVNELAPDLIDRSRAVIAMNSTVVLEARLRGKPVIVPLFEEAAAQCNGAMYFRDFFDLFNLASSRTQMIEMLDAARQGKLTPNGETQRLDELAQRYFGNSDGRAAFRIIERLEQLKENAAMRQVRESGALQTQRQSRQ